MVATFVHLSDIHFGQEREGGALAINTDARRQLLKDAADVVAALPQGRASGIIVTGDVAYAGKQKEYVDAGNWLDQLAECVGCEPSDIQLIPGNHDIDRGKIAGAAAWMLETIYRDGEAALDQFLGSDVDREVLYSRFHAYRPFADAYQCPLDCAGENSADRRVELSAHRALRFVRMNSALICTKDQEEYGNLLLGARQRVLHEAAGEELVVLVHHPLNWISDADDARKYLRGRARVVMTGHEHLASVDIERVEDGCELMMIAAGATTPDKIDNKYTYAYNVIEFDWEGDQDALAVTIHPRRWNDDLKRFEADDGRLGDYAGRNVLGSPNFRRGNKVHAEVAPAAQGENAEVEIVVPEEDNVTLGGNVSDTEFQNLHLRFFRDLGAGDRLRILVELDAVPPGMRGNFTHDIESRLLRNVAKGERFAELKEKVIAALAKRNGVGGEK